MRIRSDPDPYFEKDRIRTFFAQRYSINVLIIMNFISKDKMKGRKDESYSAEIRSDPNPVIFDGRIGSGIFFPESRIRLGSILIRSPVFYKCMQISFSSFIMKQQKK